MTKGKNETPDLNADENIEETIDHEMDDYVSEGSDQGELQKLQEEYKKLDDTYMRLYADFDNYRKRVIKEKYEMSSYAISGIMTKLIGVIDNFDRALKDESEKTSSFYEGVKMVSKQLSDILTDEGLSPIETVGVKFDPNVHHAVLTDSDPKQEDDIILEALQPGYRYKEKVIRPAMVKVNKL